MSGDLLLDLFLTLLQSPDLLRDLPEGPAQGADRIVRLGLLTADLGQFLLDLPEPGSLLLLQSPEAGEPGPDRRPVLHLLQDPGPFLFDPVSEQCRLFLRGFMGLQGLFEVLSDRLRGSLSRPDLLRQVLFLGRAVLQIPAQNLLLVRKPPDPLLRRPDLFLEDLDVALDPAAHDAGVRDPVPDGFDPLLQRAAALLEGFDPGPQGLASRLRFRKVLRRRGLLRLQLLQLPGILFVFDQKSVDIQALERISVAEVDPGLLLLLLQGGDLFLQLTHDVRQPGQVVALALQLFQGLVLAVLVLDNTGRLVKEGAPVLGLVGQDPVDLALADDGVALLADTGVIEELVDIAQTADRPVEEVLALAAPVDPARHRHLPVIDGERPVRIVQCDGNISKAKRPACLCPREDDILHRGPAQLLDSLLAQHPPDRVRDIALAAAVGSHDPGDAVLKFKSGFVCKGLEALNFDTF